MRRIRRRRRRIIEEDEEEEEEEEDISGDNVNDPCALLTLVRTQPPVEKRK